ncbi:MAG: Crp/Fnr family transcriptional regulator [Bacteroidota bacterium]
MSYSTFLNYIHKRSTLNQEARNDMISKLNLVEAKKGDYLLKEGNIPHHLWFLVSGSVRRYYFHNDKKVTSWIHNENQIVTSYGTFFDQAPSYEFIQATEDAVLISISYTDLHMLYKRHTNLQNFERILLQEFLSSLDKFYRGFIFMTALQKYESILEYFPDITQRVNLGYIASWLGISQETLSRVRRKRKSYCTTTVKA